MMRVPQLVARVRAVMNHHPVSGIVAVSGGADSVALLRSLLAANVSPLHVAHFDHQLRGDESCGDAEFVRDLAANLDLSFHLGTANVAEVASSRRESLESTARHLRYDWLGRLAETVDAKWIATGHTIDDQAETILHHLIRGSSLQGVRGIAATISSKSQGYEIVRPLLAISRTEIVDYLESIGQPFRHDSSNDDPRFTRNRIRSELLPLLKTFNPEVVTALSRFGSQMGQVHELVSLQALDLLAKAERPRAGEVIILDCLPLVSAPAIIATTALRHIWEREGWPLGEMGFDHWAKLLDQVRGGPPARDYPRGITVKRRGNILQLACTVSKSSNVKNTSR